MEALLNYYKANYPRAPYADVEMPKVKCPTLMIHGLDDPALLPGGLNDTWKHVEAELSIVTVPKAGHWVQHDAPEIVNRTMARWLAQ